MPRAGVEFDAKTKDLARVRAGGACEGCGAENVPLEHHHRKFKSRGGLGVVENDALLCGWGNHTGCHGRAHGPKPPVGWSVASWSDPGEIEFEDLHGNRWLFLPDGTKTCVGRLAGNISTVEVDPWKP